MAGPMFTRIVRSLFLLVLLACSTVSQCDFACDDGRCIYQYQVCDGYPDCNDNRASDELNCATLTDCPLHFERCPGTIGATNNVCIHPQWRCDGDNDCGDMSDEDLTFCQTTQCPSSMVKCLDSFRCLAGFTHCNGVNECRDGSDEPDECTDPNFTCPTDHFKCLHGLQCIPNTWLCDQEDDCGDNSDEDESQHNCSNHTCGDEYFTCDRNRPGYSRCIPHALVCDGFSHCEFAEDEDPVMCGMRDPCDPFYEYACENLLCIPVWWRCDHDNDCGDGSDEGAECLYPTCSNDQFLCNNGRCVSATGVCNGYNDCRDSSDEDNCSCGDGEFQCANKQCIPEGSVCNGASDCSDGSDELDTCNINECISNAYPSCEGGCVDDPLFYHCTCDDGYALNDDGLTCSDFDECQETPWVCDQICNNRIGTYECDCQSGYLLLSDGSDCVVAIGGDPYLVFANRYYIRRLGVEVNSSDYERIAQGFDVVVALDYDYSEQKLYFSDVSNQSIYRMNMDGTNREIIHSQGVADVEGIAIDWVTKKMYWTDRAADVLEVSNLDGSNRLALLRTGLFEPRDMAVDPLHGYLYWVDWGLRAYIGRLGMDGTDKVELHNEMVGWPNGLTIDYPSGTIYWVDAHLDYIAYSDLNFLNIHRLLHDENGHTIAHPFGITVFDDYIYYTDWNLKKIFKAHKYGGKEVELKTLIHRPFGIHIVHELRQPSVTRNVCNSNPCHGLCLIAPGGTSHTCACAENYELLLELDGSSYCVPQCPQGQVACNGEHKCIPWYRQCNGIQDCADNMDESGCPIRACPAGHFQCRNGDCIESILWLCDGDNDCSDRSDEDMYARCGSTACEAWQFKCLDTGGCITNRRVCDKTVDCQDGSDEDPDMCRIHECPEGFFQCTDGYCIPLEWKCDLDDDCGDGSDEPHRECQNSPCPAGWFSCLTNYRCIPQYAVCNTYDDCRDNSDEIECVERTCDPLGEFRCDNHRCIPQRWYCDFDNDCGDSSDEPIGCEHRQCSESEFRCVNRGRCIRGQWVCDGNADCSDGSDEAHELCSDIVCRTNQFECGTGACIATNRTCNGISDCSDNSDEFDCPDIVCTREEFRCRNTRCIPNSNVCDAFDDCGDRSDETRNACRTVVCPSSHIQCLVNDVITCLPEYRKCDGIQDCTDNRDEMNCEVFCSADTFSCHSGQCISWGKVCNSDVDCSDGTDEISCYKNPISCNQTNCQKECIILDNTSVCTCGSGFVEDTDGCQDINECYVQNPCLQVCTNIKGGYECSCAVGFFEKEIHGLNCKAGDRGVILFGTYSEIRKYDQEMDEYVDIVEKERRVESLDFDFNSGSVYFTDSSLRAVKKVAFTNAEPLEAPDNLGLDNVYKPMGIAVDWLGNNIYFTDQGLPPDDTTRGRRATADRGPKVVVAALRSHPYHEKTLHQASIPYAIAVNPRLGLMYWTDHDEQFESRLFMSWMNGANKTAVSSAAGKLDKPTGLAIDYTGNDTVFFCDPRHDKIGYITYDGSLFRFIVTTGGLSNPFSLDVFGNHIIWTTRNTSEIGKIRTMTKTGADMSDLISGVNFPTGIKVWQESRYPLYVPNPCARNPCLYLCLIVPPRKENSQVKNFECACPSGVNIDPSLCEAIPKPCECLNGGTCSKDGSGTCICPAKFSGSNCAIPDKQAGVPGTSATIGLAAGLGAFIIIAVIIILILVLVFLKKRRKDYAGQVTYRDGQNVDLHPPPPGRTVEPSTIYETTLNPQAPVTFENPAYPNPVGAAGGGVALGEKSEKAGLAYDPAMYQPGYQAEPLPPKAFLPDGTPVNPTGMQPDFSEPPPAYTPNNPPPPPPDTKDPNQ